MAEQELAERPPTSGAATVDRSVRGPNAMILREPDMKWLDIPRDQLVGTLGASLYPGAKAESIRMVLDYCEAAGLNVMLKPVHIVPMSVKEGSQYRSRDVVMPGINHYRVQASRTGTYLGKSEPEWGPLVERKWGEFAMNVPEWCKVTVKRLVGTHVAEFTALEYWDENYATKGRDSATPNAMWQKRPKGQLHKCTEAQALRIAFPELVGTETAEEMEGKVIDLTAEDITTRPAAVRSLDQFAGQRTQHTESERVSIEDDSQAEDAQVEEIEASDIAPEMPADAYNAFYKLDNPTTDTPDWQPGWKWLNETLEQGKFTDGARQELAERYARLLWAVYNSDAKAKRGGGPQCKAVMAFVEKHGMIVPTEPGDASAK